MAEEENETTHKILSDIRKLLIFNMLENGYSQAKVAEALGTSQASISRLFSKSKATPNNKAAKG